jgi:hypothetical protein
VGRTVRLNGRAREIIGATPDSFRFLDRNVSLVLPHRFDRGRVFLGDFSYRAIARLKPGTSIDAAGRDVARLIPVSLTRFPPFAGVSLKSFEVVIVSESLARELWSAPSAAIGKRVRPYTSGPWREVVGVMSDIRDDGVHENAPAAACFPMLMAGFDPSEPGRIFVSRSMSYMGRSSRAGSIEFATELEQAIWSVTRACRSRACAR